MRILRTWNARTRTREGRELSNEGRGDAVGQRRILELPAVSAQERSNNKEAEKKTASPTRRGGGSHPRCSISSLRTSSPHPSPAVSVSEGARTLDGTSRAFAGRRELRAGP